MRPVDTAAGGSPKVVLETGSARQTLEIAPNLNKLVPVTGDALHGKDRGLLARLPDQEWLAREREPEPEQSPACW